MGVTRSEFRRTAMVAVGVDCEGTRVEAERPGRSPQIRTGEG